MKKILVIHNNYRNIGGEDIAVENELTLLKEDFEVKTLYFSNNIDNYFNQIYAFLTNKNLASMKKLANVIESYNPDYAYVHNTWFNASLGIFQTLNSYNIKTIVKLHNFRYDCTQSYLLSGHLKGSDECGKCGLKKSLGSIFNMYYKDSVFKSLLVVKYGKKYFKLIKDGFFKIFVLTEFHKQHLINLGVDEKKIEVFPNYVHIPESSNYEPENYIVYAGRISEEKGVENLIKVFLNSKLNNIKLKILGDGPLKTFLQNTYKSKHIEFTGVKSNRESLEEIRKSKAVITATKMFEGQPTLLCEASSFGVPAIFPKTGGIAEFFPENYLLSFEQFDYKDLNKKMTYINDPELMKNLGNKNKEFLNSSLNKDKLKNIFKKIINDF